MKNQILATILSFLMAITATLGFTQNTEKQSSGGTQTEQGEKPSKSTRDILGFLDN